MPTPVRPRIEQLLQAMTHQLYEKEQVVSLVLLAALAGESVFLLGPPGVAKSMIARRLKFALADAKAFEYLMGKFSTPDEVFGPVSIKKLKDEDKYERLYEQYLPGANIVFLDEIWKASPPIQNALLTVLNEKIFRNGDHEIHVDLRALISASNELPHPGEGLEALWDRFLLRLMVDNIALDSEEDFAQLVGLPRHQVYSDPIPAELKIDRETYGHWQILMDGVELPNHVLGLLQHLRRSLHDRNESAESDTPIYVSDRRWRKIVELLKASAFLHDRNEVMVVDAFLIAHCIWGKVEQIDEVVALVQGSIASYGYRRVVDLRPLEAELQSLQTEIDEETHLVYQKEEDVPRRYRDDMGNEYVRLMQYWGDGHGYLRVQDYKKLNDQEPVNVPVYEQSPNGYRPFQTIGFVIAEPHVLRDKSKDRQIDTKTVQREVRESKAPPQELKKIWTNQVLLLLEHCERGLMTLEERKATDEPHLQGHLFVPEAWASQALQSLEATQRDLVNLKLEIQKVRYQYESVETD